MLPDSNTSYEYLQLYTINLDNPLSERSIREFINGAFLENTKVRSDYFDNQINNLGQYLSLAAELKERDDIVLTSTNNLIRRDNRRFKRLRVNHLKDIIDNLVSRFSSKTTTFFMTPRHSAEFTGKVKAKLVRKLVDTVLYSRNFSSLLRRMVRDNYIYGESYIHVFWDDQLGELKQKDKGIRVPLKGDNGQPLKDESGKIVYINPLLREGDVNMEVLDPTSVRVQPGNEFTRAEWVIIEKQIPIERLRHQYPEVAAKIKPTERLEVFDTVSFEYIKSRNLVRVLHLYHRPTEELPKGREIIVTPDVILKNQDLSVNRLWGDLLFPVLQLTDVDIPNDPRGYAGSVMEVGKGLQLAINNLYNICLRNIAKFPPMRLWPEGGVNLSALKGQAPMDVSFNERRGKPDFISLPPIHQEILMLIDRLTQRLMQVTNVLPISRGETIPNTESRLMLDFFKEQENAQSVSMDSKIQEFLVGLAKVVLAFVLEFYDDSDKRMLKVFGKRQQYTLENFKLEDINIPVDIHIQRGVPFASTQQGRIGEISALLGMFPGIVSPQEAIDIFELGEPDKLYDSVTGAIDLAEANLEAILAGKTVKSPDGTIQLIPYYETLIKALQNQTIREILPEIPDLGADDIGNKLLSHINTVEFILSSKAEANPLLKQMMLERFPTFPAVFTKDAIVSVDPTQALDPVIPELPSELGDISASGTVPES